ncbi:MAG: MiaB/RimO family radical SAM methylthiotransferase [Papillibacter sp.]|nr:MiaB/RimO family radical SAM methylthiotransferase [Papillibacter sp.]
MKFLFYTLGCRVNQFETAAMEEELKSRGHEIVSDGADVVVVNSCAVTAESARKSRQAARRLLTNNPGALLAVCGCWPQAEPVQALDSGAVLISGSGGRLQFIESLEKLAVKSEPAVLTDEPRQRRELEVLPPARLEGRTRAYLKVQDGCRNYCAYCIIPYLRGPVRSLPIAEAEKQAARLFESGVREITLTGIELASYEYGLDKLILAVSKAAPGLRLRLGSLEPRIITQEFCETISDIKGFCPHFHLSLQSGCDETLKRMGRRYDTARFYESVKLLREHFDNCGISADLITGFPGETEEEFNKTLEFIKECDFMHVHVFPYSERKGTKAADMPDKVLKSVRLERAARALETAGEMEKRFLLNQVGRSAEVLFESKVGHTPNNCPVLPFPGTKEGSIMNVKLTGLDEGKMSLTAMI